MSDREKIIKEQLSFAETDTICFFSPDSQELRDLQKKEWAPVIGHINAFGCNFKATEGLEAQKLSEQTKCFLQERLNSFSDEKLSAFCAVSGGCRSVLLALAVADGFLTAEQAFETAILEERYHTLFWKEDEDTRISKEGRKESVLQAAEKLKGCKNG